MIRIRKDTDFVIYWAIERGGLPEDLTTITDAKLIASVFGEKTEVPFTVSGNILKIELTPSICPVTGVYNLQFNYTLPDLTLSDGDRKCAVDIDAFQIVSKTAQASEGTEFSMTSDMAIAFKGDKGDSAYQVWLDAGNIGTEEDYFAYLRQPAIDAGASISELEGAIQVSEGLRVQAESERVTAETGRVNAETERVNAETERVTNINNLFENVNELSELDTFDVTKKQRLVHELGILKWEDYE